MRQNACIDKMELAGMKKFLMAAVLMLLIPVSWGKTFLIDVRTPEEFSAGHIEGAINIEYQGIEQKITQSGADRNDEVILYCHSGRRAGIARDTLLKAGFVNVQNYGGMEEARKRLITRPHTRP
jgi:phage shock protein E